MPENKNLWEEVGNKCLTQAIEVLNKETIPNIENVEIVSKLVNTAIAIDSLNLQWAVQSRYGEQVFPHRLSSQKLTENSTEKHAELKSHLDH